MILQQVKSFILLQIREMQKYRSLTTPSVDRTVEKNCSHKPLRMWRWNNSYTGKFGNISWDYKCIILGFYIPTFENLCCRYMLTCAKQQIYKVNHVIFFHCSIFAFCSSREKTKIQGTTTHQNMQHF